MSGLQASKTAPPPPANNTDPKAGRTALALVMALGLLTRLLGLGSACLGPNEALHLLTARYGATTPTLDPVFQRLCAIWIRSGLGGTEWRLRLLPALLGIAVIWGVYRLGKELCGTRAALVSALFVCVSPAFVAQSQRLADGGLLDLAVLFPTVFLTTTRRDSHWTWWTLYTVSVCLSLYVSPCFAAVLLALNLWYFVAYVNARRVGPWMLANGAALAAYLPYAYLLLRDKPWLRLPRTVGAPGAFVWRALEKAATGPLFSPTLRQVCAIIVLAGALSGIVLMARRNAKAALLLLTLAGVPLLIATWLVSLGLPATAFQLLPLALPIYIAGAAGCAAPQHRRFRWSLIGLVSLLLLAGRLQTQMVAPWRHCFPQDEPRYAYRTAAQYISRHYRKGDLVGHADASSLAPLWFQWNGSRPLPNTILAYGPISRDDPTTAALSTLGPAYSGPREPTQVAPATDPYARVWLVYSAADRRRLGKQPRLIKQWFDAHLFEMDHQVFPGIELFLYVHEIAGHWTRLEGRDRDDGVSARLTYWHGPEETYHQFREDAALTPTPIDQRRGRLRLQFDATPTGNELIPLDHDPNTREQGFSLTSISRKPVQVRIMVAATARLLDITRMTKQNPDSAAWTLAPMMNPSPPPPAWPLSVMTVRLANGQTRAATLNGGINLDAGSYDFYLYQRPGPSNPRAPLLSLTVDDQLVYRSAGKTAAGVTPWTWTPAGHLKLKLKDDLVHVNLTAALVGVTTAGKSECAYLAITPRRTQPPGAKARRRFWQGQAEMEPGETRHWRIPIDALIQRLDVWVVEQDRGGGGYRIFKTVGD